MLGTVVFGDGAWLSWLFIFNLFNDLWDKITSTARRRNVLKVIFHGYFMFFKTWGATFRRFNNDGVMFVTYYPIVVTRGPITLIRGLLGFNIDTIGIINGYLFYFLFRSIVSFSIYNFLFHVAPASAPFNFPLVVRFCGSIQRFGVLLSYLIMNFSGFRWGLNCDSMSYRVVFISFQ